MDLVIVKAPLVVLRRLDMKVKNSFSLRIIIAMIALSNSYSMCMVLIMGLFISVLI